MRTLIITILLLFSSHIITGQDLIVDNRVGIGTTTASAPLHVKGNNEALRIEGIQPWLSFYTGATRNGYLQHDGSDMWLVNDQDGDLFFRTNNITRMFIDNQGDVGIGTTNPIYKFHVVATGAAIHGTSDSYVGILGDSNDPDDFDFLALTLDGSNGYGETSSIRWKTNIQNIDNPIITLSQLRGVYFNWKEEFGGNHAIGFIAEEVGKVLPEIVVYEDNGIDATGLDYSKMTPLLVEAANAMRREYLEKLDGQQSEIDDQQSEIDALRQEIAELRTLLKSQVKNASED